MIPGAGALRHEHLLEAPRILDWEDGGQTPSGERRRDLCEPGDSEIFVERVLLAKPFGTYGSAICKTRPGKDLLEA